MDLPVLLLVAAIATLATGAGALVWHLTPDRPRLLSHPAVPHPATDHGPAEIDAAARQWQTPAVVERPARPEARVDEPASLPVRERIRWQTRALGAAGAIVWVLVGAVAVAGGFYFIGRLLVEQFRSLTGS